MSNNLAARSREERDRINVDLAASGVAYKERMNQPVIPHEVEMQQTESMREYFRERLQHSGVLRFSSRAALTLFIRRKKSDE